MAAEAQTQNDDNPSIPLSRTLRIDKLSRNISDSHLQNIFATYGELESVSVQIDAKVKLSLGWALIEFKERRDAEKAYQRMNNGQIDGKPVSIKFKELSLGSMLPSRHKDETDNNDKAKSHPAITRVATDVYDNNDMETSTKHEESNEDNESQQSDRDEDRGKERNRKRKRSVSSSRESHKSDASIARRREDTMRYHRDRDRRRNRERMRDRKYRTERGRRNERSERRERRNRSRSESDSRSPRRNRDRDRDRDRDRRRERHRRNERERNRDRDRKRDRKRSVSRSDSSTRSDTASSYSNRSSRSTDSRSSVDSSSDSNR